MKYNFLALSMIALLVMSAIPVMALSVDAKGPVFMTHFDNSMKDEFGSKLLSNNIHDKFVGDSISGAALSNLERDEYAEYDADVFNPKHGSVAVWFKADDFSSNDQVLWHTDDSKYVLGYDHGSSWTYKRLYMRAGGQEHEASYYITKENSPLNLEVGQWYLLGATWDSEKNVVKIYLDGELQGEAKFEASEQPETFRIGNNYWPGQSFSMGNFDNLRLYDRILTSSDFSYIYKTELPSTIIEPAVVSVSLSPSALEVQGGDEAHYTISVTDGRLDKSNIQKTYKISLHWLDGLKTDVEKTVTLTTGETKQVPLTIWTINEPYDHFYTFEVLVSNDETEATAKADLNVRSQVIPETARIDVELSPNTVSIFDDNDAHYTVIVTDKRTEKSLRPVRYYVAIHGLEHFDTEHLGSVELIPGETKQFGLTVHTHKTYDRPLIPVSGDVVEQAVGASARTSESVVSTSISGGGSAGPSRTTYNFQLRMSSPEGLGDVAAGTLHIMHYKPIPMPEPRPEPFPEPPAFPEESQKTISLRQGWNLVGVPGMTDQFDSTCRQKLISYVWLADKQEYVTLQQAKRILGNQLDEYLSDHAIWVYAKQSCSLTMHYKQTNYSPDFVTGWNIIPVSKEMIGNPVSEYETVCSSLAFYRWNGSWELVEAFSESDYLHGVAVKNTMVCTR